MLNYLAFASVFGEEDFLSVAFAGLSPFEAAAVALAGAASVLASFFASFLVSFFAGLAASCAKLAEPNAATATNVTNIFFILCDFDAKLMQIQRFAK